MNDDNEGMGLLVIMIACCGIAILYAAAQWIYVQLY